MKTTAAAFAVIAAFAVTSCSSTADSTPALTDDQLAREYVQTVQHMNFEDVADPTAVRRLTIDLANTNCDLLRKGKQDGMGSSEPGDPRNADWIRTLRQGLANSGGLTTGQEFNALTISAKYKCPEFSTALELFGAVYGN